MAADTGTPPGNQESRQELAALALASGQTVKKAAAAAGVSERGLYGWMRQADFRARVDELRSLMVSQAVGIMAEGMAGAAVTLRLLLQSAQDAIRLGAAKALLELGTRMRDSEDLARQLAELREEVRRAGGGGPAGAGGLEAAGGGPPGHGADPHAGPAA